MQLLYIQRVIQCIAQLVSNAEIVKKLFRYTYLHNIHIWHSLRYFSKCARQCSAGATHCLFWQSWIIHEAGEAKASGLVPRQWHRWWAL